MANLASIKNSNISNIANQDSTQAFIDCILLYSKNLEADAVSIELQVSDKKTNTKFSHQTAYFRSAYL